MRHVLAAFATAITLAGCREGNEVRGSYRLVAIGDTALGDYRRAAECFEIPAASMYTFVGQQWHSTDTARRMPACLTAGQTATRADSGFYQLVRDTLRLFVADTMTGAKGLVWLGTIKKDTIRFLGSELDPGDFVYVRQR